MNAYFMIYFGLGLAVACVGALAVGYTEDLPFDPSDDGLPMTMTAAAVILFWPLAFLGMLVFALAKYGQRLARKADK